MTDVFANARLMFEALPGDVTLRRAVGHLARHGIEAGSIRTWARSIAQEYGTWDYCGPNFESHIMAPGLRLAAAQLETAGG